MRREHDQRVTTEAKRQVAGARVQRFRCRFEGVTVLVEKIHQTGGLLRERIKPRKNATYSIIIVRTLSGQVRQSREAENTR